MSDLIWAPHPIHPTPVIVSRSGAAFVCRVGERSVLMTPDQLAEYWAARENGIRMERERPLTHGYEPWHWPIVDDLLTRLNIVCIFGGNQAGKTEFALKRGMQRLANEENINVLFLQNNELASKQLHQKTVWKYMPPEWRSLKRSKGNQRGNISYDDKNGFGDNVFTTPLGGTAIFGNYGQALDKYEGLQFDLIVADENLPLKWFEALKRGLSTRRGKMLWAFTPIDGMTPAIAEVAAGARTLRSLPVDPELLDPTMRHVDDCPPGEMPFVAERNGVGIVYFHSVLNAFGDFANLKSLYGHKSVDVRERRFYGFARRLSRVLLPKFGANHIVPHAELMGRISGARVSRFQIMDPAGARNMFMLWVAVDSEGRHFVYREWPDVPSCGEWAVASEDPRRWDGDAGPAQPTLGYGVLEYKGMILRLEGNVWDKGGWEMSGEVIDERYVDPRSGAAQSIAERDGGSSLIDRFADEQVDREGKVTGPALDLRAAPGLPENEGIHGNQEGVQGINDLLSFDESEPVVALLNEPRLFVSDACENLIWAMQNYTGNDGAKAACKDPMDCLRYLATADLEYLENGGVMVSGGGYY